MEYSPSLLTHRRDITTDAAELARAFFRAEAPADLLLQLDHAQIPLGLIIGTMKGRA